MSKIENLIAEMQEEIKKLSAAIRDLLADAPKYQTQDNGLVAVNGVQFKMIDIPAGSFEMSCTSELKEYEDDEKPPHIVNINAFRMMETEVTQELWQAVMGNNPSYFAGCAVCPVENVSWDDAQAFIVKLNELTGGRYRLPSESEWEYAARAGQNYKYAGSDNIEDVAWYDDNSGDKTQPVKTKKPNAWGLYDMSGNVWEWTETGYIDSSRRVIRGGSWFSGSISCRLADRRGSQPPTLRFESVGFRLAKSK